MGMLRVLLARRILVVVVTLFQQGLLEPSVFLVAVAAVVWSGKREKGSRERTIWGIRRLLW
jgi:hypothetical protein